MAKLKGLGRGLDGLLDKDPPMRQQTKETANSMLLSALQPGKYQPRSYMDGEALNTLADSIRTQGVIQPILVRPISGGQYEILAGERRWRAARIAGLTQVPVIIREVADQQALAVALIENIQREDLNALEEANGIARLINEFALTHQAVAEAIGKSRTAVTNLLRLLELAPPVKALLGSGQLDMGHARALLPLPVGQQLAIAQAAITGGWSVRAVEQQVAAALKPYKAQVIKTATVDRDVARLEESLAQQLGTRVEIDSKPKGKGRLVIHYSNLDQLDGIISQLTKKR